MTLMRAARLALLGVIVALLVGCVMSRGTSGLSLPGLHGGLTSTIYGRRPMVLLRTHEGIWEDVRQCLGSRAADAPASWGVRWSLADSIRVEDGFWAYGLTVWRQIGPPEIILEARWWLNPGIISHEAIHVMTQDSSHVGAAWLCVMPTYDPLPMRLWTDLTDEA